MLGADQVNSSLSRLLYKIYFLTDTLSYNVDKQDSKDKKGQILTKG